MSFAALLSPGWDRMCSTSGLSLDVLDFLSGGAKKWVSFDFGPDPCRSCLSRRNHPAPSVPRRHRLRRAAGARAGRPPLAPAWRGSDPRLGIGGPACARGTLEVIGRDSAAGRGVTHRMAGHERGMPLTGGNCGLEGRLDFLGAVVIVGPAHVRNNEQDHPVRAHRVGDRWHGPLPSLAG